MSNCLRCLPNFLRERVWMVRVHVRIACVPTWNKRFEGSKKKGFLDGYVVKKEAHKWELMAEYILFYTFDNL